MIALKCTLVFAVLVVVWLFSYLVGVKVTGKYAAEMLSLALDEVTKKIDTAEADKFAAELIRELTNNF